jgi:hypothetical protein
MAAKCVRSRPILGPVWGNKQASLPLSANPVVGTNTEIWQRLSYGSLNRRISIELMLAHSESPSSRPFNPAGRIGIGIDREVIRGDPAGVPHAK